MKALLRHTITKQYLRNEDEWTAERSVARNFVTGPQAILFALEKRLANVEVVLAFDNPQYDISLPVRTSRGTPPQSPGLR